MNRKKKLSLAVSFCFDFDFALFSLKMRRSMAPSSLAKRKEGITDENTTPDLTFLASSALAPVHRTKRACVLNSPRLALCQVKVNKFEFAPDNKTFDEIANDVSSHDEFIRKILNRPFKVPIANYVGKFFL